MSKANFKNCYVFIANNGSVEHRKVKLIDGGTIETEKELIPESDCRKYFNSEGGISYFIDVDLPQKVELENLKKLRRSVALNRIFEYDKGKTFNIMSILPYLIAIIAIMF